MAPLGQQENQAVPLALGQWQRHVLETELPWRAVFVDGRDLDGDGLPDLVTGGWWCPNPGSLAALDAEVAHARVRSQTLDTHLFAFAQPADGLNAGEDDG